MFKTSRLVREYRLKNHKTQLEVGECLGTSGQLISNLERGSYLLSIDNLKKISIFLSIPIEEMKKAFKEDKDQSIENAFKDIA